MALRNLFRKLLLVPLLAAPLGALAEPIYSLTFLPQNFYASGINNAGHVVGTAGGGAAIWSDTSITYLAPGSEGLAINNHDEVAILTFGGYADFGNAVNNAGQIAGFASAGSGHYTNPVRNAFLYDVFGNVSNLGSLGGRVSEANHLNDAGLAACRSGVCATVRLDLISAVPEPKIWGMLLAGLALMGSRRRRAFRSETFS